MPTAIVIPARYGSKRLQGKPLRKIGNTTLLQRVVHLAKSCAEKENIPVLVATEDQRIFAHAEECGAYPIMTPSSCPTGTDRVHFAIELYQETTGTTIDFVLNMQGDAPFTPKSHIQALLQAEKKASVLTPVYNLSWQELEALREHKRHSPFSGTTAIVDTNGYAVWFSKNILPAIRHEEALRETSLKSPVYRHIGLYGYTTSFLKNYVTWPESLYEQLEGLEQLRILERGEKIQACLVEEPSPSLSGIDTERDLELANRLEVV